MRSDTMAETSLSLNAGLASGARGLERPISLRTITTIRWVALAGQALALLLVHFGLGFELPLTPCLLIVVASALVNMVAQVELMSGSQLSDKRAAVFLALDLLQLSVLLYLTGGLENPFALLILAPVTVAATVLSVRSTLMLSALALAMASALAVWHDPLPWTDEGFTLPTLYRIGLWVAIVIAIIFTTAYVRRLGAEAWRMSDALAATQMALAREQRLSALGGLAAAAAHELGSPLSTIAVIAADLARDVPAESEFSEDIILLKSESDRCRDILAGLARLPDGDPEAPFERTPLSAIVDAAAAPHQRDRVQVILEQHGSSGRSMPVMAMLPELLHGLGTLIQNATQFATAAVEITIEWDEAGYSVTIEDDGPGFSPTVIGRLGEPYLSSRAGRDGHMGLGIFIAKTLLERTGAVLSFTNRGEGGASIHVSWPVRRS
jgi:two-component system sensor histidine kinase RegB